MANYGSIFTKHAAAKISVEYEEEEGGREKERQIKERKTHDVAEWNSVIMGIAIEQINSSIFYIKSFFRAFL